MKKGDMMHDYIGNLSAAEIRGEHPTPEGAAADMIQWALVRYGIETDAGTRAKLIEEVRQYAYSRG